MVWRGLQGGGRGGAGLCERAPATQGGRWGLGQGQVGPRRRPPRAAPRCHRAAELIGAGGGPGRRALAKATLCVEEAWAAPPQPAWHAAHLAGRDTGEGRAGGVGLGPPCSLRTEGTSAAAKTVQGNHRLRGLCRKVGRGACMGRASSVAQHSTAVAPCCGLPAAIKRLSNVRRRHAKTHSPPDPPRPALRPVAVCVPGGVPAALQQAASSCNGLSVPYGRPQAARIASIGRQGGPVAALRRRSAAPQHRAARPIHRPPPPLLACIGRVACCTEPPAQWGASGRTLARSWTLTSQRASWPTPKWTLAFWTLRSPLRRMTGRRRACRPRRRAPAGCWGRAPCVPAVQQPPWSALRPADRARAPSAQPPPLPPAHARCRVPALAAAGSHLPAHPGRCGAGPGRRAESAGVPGCDGGRGGRGGAAGGAARVGLRVSVGGGEWVWWLRAVLVACWCAGCGRGRS